MNVTLPNGNIISDVPDGTPKDAIMAKAILSGLAVESDFAPEQPVQQPVAQPETPLNEDYSALTGVADIAGMAGAEMLRSGAQGISTVGGLINPFSTPSEAVAGGEALAEALPEYNLGEDAQALISDIGQKYGEYAPDLLKELVNQASIPLGSSIGESVYQATESPVLASLAGAVPTALEAATVARPAKAVAGAISKGAGQVADTATDVAKAVDLEIQQLSPTKQKMVELINSGSVDKQTAQFLVEDTGRLATDVPAKEAIKQGFSDRTIAAIKRGSPSDKAKAREMADIAKRVSSDAEYAIENRPSDVPGDSLLDRFRAVKRINSTAGKRVDKAATKLKGETIEVDPIIDSFADDLERLGVSIDEKLNPEFKGSNIEFNPTDQKVIHNIFTRIKRLNRTGDAKEAHDLKKLIDNQVTFGKGESFTSGSEGVLKSLRKNIDAALDGKFADYDEANTAYSETISAINALQDVAGRKINLDGKNANKQAGTLLRRLMGNPVSRIPLMDAVKEIDNAATNGGIRFKDNIYKQIIMADELEEVFKIPPRTAIQSQIKQAAGAAIEAKAGIPTTALRRGAEVIDKARGINEEGAYKAIRELLKPAN